MSVGGFKYALIFVDRATHYNWCFGLKSLHHDDIIAAFLAFSAEAGNLACQFCCDCDEKLYGSRIRLFLHLKHLSILLSPAGCQSANGLVESHWKIMVHMSCAYLAEKQMPCSFWYYLMKHSARMMNMIPGKYRNKLAAPFMLVYGVCPDQRTWLPFFLICYFHCMKDNNVQHSKNRAHTLDGIVIGCSPTSNAIVVYNPRNQCYYEPDSYKIDPYQLPSWFTLQSFTMVVYLFPYIVATFLLSVNLIPLVLGLRKLAPATTLSFDLVPSWTFPLTQQLPHSTSSNLMMSLQNWFLPPRCPPS
jgi:hypothetical protein